MTTAPITPQKRVTVTDTVKLPQLRVAFLTPPAFASGDADADLAIDILGSGKASRLDQVLVYKQQVAQSARCSNNSQKLASITECTITAKPNVKLEDLEATFWQELGKLQTDGPTQQELDSARSILLTQTISGLERLGGFGGIADTLNRYNQYTGDPGYLPQGHRTLQGSHASQPEAGHREVLQQGSAVVVYCVPGKKVVDDVPRSPLTRTPTSNLRRPTLLHSRSSRTGARSVPAAGPAVAFTLPTPKTFTLENGLQVYVVEDKQLPVLSAGLVTRAGSENNAPAQAGLATLTAALLNEGTKSRNATQLANDHRTHRRRV